MNKKIMIEIIVKSVIVFTCISIIDEEMKNYILNNYGGWSYTAFLLGTNLTGMLILNIYFARRMPRLIKANFFKKYVNNCLNSYQISKRKLLTDNKEFYSNPFHLIHATALQEFILVSYTDNSLEAEYITIKHSLLTALVEEDSDKLLADIGKMKALLMRFEYAYKR